MPQPISHTEAMLGVRNELLEELWDLDVEIRNRHNSGAWKRGGKQTVEYNEMIEERHRLADELKEMGVVPWTFHPKHDNSWLVVQRGRLASIGST